MMVDPRSSVGEDQPCRLPDWTDLTQDEKQVSAERFETRLENLVIDPVDYQVGREHILLVLWQYEGQGLLREVGADLKMEPYEMIISIDLMGLEELLTVVDVGDHTLVHLPGKIRRHH